MNIKEFYLNEYPTDELGIELRDDTNFTGLLNNLYTANDVYRYLGVYDSLVRERLFSKLAEILDATYDYVYNLWLK